MHDASGLARWPIDELVKMQAYELAGWFDRQGLPQGAIFRDPQGFARTWDASSAESRRLSLEGLEAAWRTTSGGGP